jgi:sigma-E factor negative regulatory protein RseA
MTDRIREQISALIDGELPEDEIGLLVLRLERDEQLRLAFGRFVLAGEAIRSPGGPLASRGFAASVSAAVDEDAAVAVTVGDAGTPAGFWWNRPAFATGIAASAALVAVLLVGRGAHEAGQIAQASLERVRDSFATLQQPIGQAASPTPAHSQRLAGYLIAHGQFSSTIGRRTAWSSVLASDPGLTRTAYESLEAP